MRLVISTGTHQQTGAFAPRGGSLTGFDDSQGDAPDDATRLGIDGSFDNDEYLPVMDGATGKRLEIPFPTSFPTLTAAFAFEQDYWLSAIPWLRFVFGKLVAGVFTDCNATAGEVGVFVAYSTPVLGLVAPTGD